MPYKNTEVNTINAAQGGKVGCNTDEYTTAFCILIGVFSVALYGKIPLLSN